MQHNDKTSRDSKNKNLWCIAENQRIQWRDWDGTYVVFSPLSGETHLLDVSSGRVLTRVINQPLSIEEIQMDLSNFLQVDSDEELLGAVVQILRELEDAGLIEPVSS